MAVQFAVGYPIIPIFKRVATVLEAYSTKKVWFISCMLYSIDLTLAVATP